MILFSGTSWVARQIKKVTKSTVNHAGLAFWEDGELYVVEALEKGIEKRTWEESIKGKGILIGVYKGDYKFELLNHEIRNLAKRANNYDYYSLLIAQPIYQWFGLWIGRSEKKAEANLYCSEAVAYVYNRVYNLFNKKWHKITPAKLMDLPDFNYFELEK
jgi:hypothetical protein